MIWTNPPRWKKERHLHPQPRGAFLQESEGEEEGFGLYVCPLSKGGSSSETADPLRVTNKLKLMFYFVFLCFVSIMDIITTITFEFPCLLSIYIFYSHYAGKMNLKPAVNHTLACNNNF